VLGGGSTLTRSDSSSRSRAVASSRTIATWRQRGGALALPRTPRTRRRDPMASSQPIASTRRQRSSAPASPASTSPAVRPGAGVSITLSAWQKAASLSLYQGYENDNTVNSLFPGTTFTGAGWQRLVVSRVTGAAVNSIVPLDARAITGGTAAARDLYSDMHQLEVGAWASEVILNATTGSVTRAGERLRFTPGSSVVQSGQVRFYAKLMPKAAATGYGSLATIRLWTGRERRDQLRRDEHDHAGDDRLDRGVNRTPPQLSHGLRSTCSRSSSSQAARWPRS
jgi:hypothetical protein